MEYLYCEKMNRQLCFNGDYIYACTVGNNTKSNSNLIIKENYNGEPFDIEQFFVEREQIKKDAKNGKIVENCEGCHYLQSRDWDNIGTGRKIDYILISNYKRCNSRCTYCISRSDYNPKKDKDPETYNIIPIIKDMIEKGYVTADTKFDFAGGECTLYSNFEELLFLLINSGIKNIIIHSNAIIYSKAIEEGIKTGKVSICVSTDSGEKKTHEKVKGVKTYSKVWHNIKKYNQVKPENGDNTVSVKYILVEKINDNPKEIESWLKKVKSIGVKRVRFNADNDIFIKYQSSNEHNHPYLAQIIILTEFFVKRANFYNIEYELDYNIDAAYKMLNVKMPNG